jgi:STE24 endopeptidase
MDGIGLKAGNLFLVFDWTYMNLLIGLVVFLCLLCSEIRAPEPVSDWGTRMLLVGFVALSVPGLALFQTLIVSRRLRQVDLEENQSNAIMTRISVCHSAVWLTASLAIIWAVRWQDVVRGTWELDRWPLVDEILILAPVILSLVASWAIFYEVQQSIDGTFGQRLKLENIKRRLGYVSIRFRIYFLMVLIPLSLAVLSRDLAPWLERLSPLQTISVYVVSAMVMMAGFPFLLLFIWGNKKIEDAELRSKLIETCKQHKLFIHDIRIWKTGNQIINALVAGILPRFRIILLTDSLVKLFPRNELLAVVRHEAGHLRLWHLPIRIGFIILPLIALALDEKNPLGVISNLESWTVEFGLPAGSGIAMIASIYLGYLLYSMSWLSHRMEFEADIYACQECSAKPGETSIDCDRAKDMSDALLRLASVSPSQFDRRTIMHPSIRERILLIRDIQDSPEKANRFRASFVRRRRMVLVALLAVCFLTQLV